MWFLWNEMETISYKKRNKKRQTITKPVSKKTPVSPKKPQSAPKKIKKKLKKN